MAVVVSDAVTVVVTADSVVIVYVGTPIDVVVGVVESGDGHICAFAASCFT